jgi:hypothetical protein
MAERKREKEKELHRRRRDGDDDTEMSSAPAKSIAAMLDAVRATESQWMVHMGTGVYYHTEACEVCKRYTEHLHDDMDKRNVSLQEALEKLERYWMGKLTRSKEFIAEKKDIEKDAHEEGFERGYERGRRDEESRRSRGGRERSLETQRTTTSSSSGSRPRSPKGKQPMTSTEIELEKMTRDNENLHRRCTQQTVEIARLRQENDSLLSTIHSRVIETAEYVCNYEGMDVDHVQATHLADRGRPRSGAHAASTATPSGSIAGRLAQYSSSEASTRPPPSSSAATGSTQPSTSSYASVAANAPKRKAAELGSTTSTSKKFKAPRVILGDSRTGLPLPMGREGILHLSGGAWDQFTVTAPGENLDAKVEWLLKHRHLPLYRDVLDEIDSIRRQGGRLHPLQRKLSNHQSESESLYEIAFNNKTKVPKGVRWVDGEPNPADMVLWDLTRTIQRSSKSSERNLMLRQALHEAVLTTALWPRGSDQSTGVRPLAYPETHPISVGSMVAHLRKCGVTTAFCGEQLRPYILRGLAQSSNVRRTAPGSPVEPGEIIPPATASTLAQQTTEETQGSSAASTPPTARLTIRARSLSAPPAPARGSSSTVTTGTMPGDEDVPMVSTDMAGNILSEPTEDTTDNRE